MQRIDEFIEKLEANQTTPNERRGFIGSLTKKEFTYFLKKDFSRDTKLSELMSSKYNSTHNDCSNHRSIDTRTDLFEEYIHQTERLIEQFTIKELKTVLPQIRPEYVTIKNLFTEHLIHLIHNTKETIDIKKIVNFKNRVENQQITYEDIRSFLLKMTKEEFSVLITLSNQKIDLFGYTLSTDDREIENMYESQAEIIAEILEEYNEDEMIELIPFLNDASSNIRTMFFKCLNEKKAQEIFLTNAPKYSRDIYSYIATPTQSITKDEIIVEILSNPKLYSLYSEIDLIFLRTMISNKEVIIEENSNIINTKEEEIKNEAAKYIANIRCREKKSISRGILKKLSAKKLYDLLKEVNKGLINVEEDEISLKEFIKLIEMPLDKAVIFLKKCIELTEEEKKRILNELYKDNEYTNMSINEAVNKITNKYIKSVVENSTYLDDNFDYCYQDLLEMNYNKGFFNDMLKSYSRNMFAITSSKCMNIFLSQLIEKTKEELGLDIQTEFYIGRAFTSDRTNQNVSLGSYLSTTKTISINTNAYSELDSQKVQTTTEEIVNIFLNRISMIQTIFHELRHAYQNEKIKEIGTVRDLYFLLDQLIHHKSSLGKIYYENNYEDDSREVDADLYKIVATASLLRTQPEVKKLYWKVFSSDAKTLAKKRKAQQLRNMWLYNSDNEKKSLPEIFNELLGGYKLSQLADEYPMLAIISDNGYILTEEELVGRYIAVEQELKEQLDDQTYEEGITILSFLGEYLDIIHNKKMQNKKQRKSK